VSNLQNRRILLSSLRMINDAFFRIISWMKMILLYPVHQNDPSNKNIWLPWTKDPLDSANSFRNTSKNETSNDLKCSKISDFLFQILYPSNLFTEIQLCIWNQIFFSIPLLKYKIWNYQMKQSLFFFPLSNHTICTLQPRSGHKENDHLSDIPSFWSLKVQNFFFFWSFLLFFCNFFEDDQWCFFRIISWMKMILLYPVHQSDLSSKVLAPLKQKIHSKKIIAWTVRKQTCLRSNPDYLVGYTLPIWIFINKSTF